MIAEIGERHRRLLGLSFALVIVLVVFSYPLMQGSIRGHDSRTHLSWLLSLMEAWRTGALYPRWLPDQFAGLGSPVFYYYPPFSSFFFSTVDWLSFHQLGAGRVMVVSGFLLSLASTGTFYWWARGAAGGSVFALVAAVFYGVAPYHFQIDYLARGAMAEFAAFVWIPLIFGGIQRWLQGQRWPDLFWLMVGCAGLFLTHLLSGMLVAMVAAPYAVLSLLSIRSRQPAVPLRRLLGATALPLVLAVMLSVGVAACYVLPALNLLPYMNQAALMYSGIDQTSLLHALDPGKTKSFLMIAGIAVLYGVGALALLLRHWSGRRSVQPAPEERTRNFELLFWCGVVLMLLLFMLGGLNILLHPPSPLQKIQFLWRALVVQEFAACSLVCFAGAGRVRAAAAKWAQTVALVLLSLFAVVSAMAAKKLYADPHAEDPARTEHVRLRMGPPEYIPLQAQELLPAQQVALYPKVMVGQAEITGFVRTTGPVGFQIKVRAAVPATVAMPAFTFPGWQVKDETGRELQAGTSTPYALVTVPVEPGDHTYTVSRVSLPQERLANGISWAAVLLSLIFLWLVRRLRARSSVAVLAAREAC